MEFMEFCIEALKEGNILQTIGAVYLGNAALASFRDNKKFGGYARMLFLAGGAHIAYNGLDWVKVLT